jgi:hypothetical protein
MFATAIREADRAPGSPGGAGSGVPKASRRPTRCRRNVESRVPAGVRRVSLIDRSRSGHDACGMDVEVLE